MKTTWTPSQIERAQKAYNAMLQYRSVQSYNPEIIGWNTAEQRSEYHNNIVSQILGGNKEVAREWELFFLKEAAKADFKRDAEKAKLYANKEASADVLAPVKAAKRLVEFGKWLNTPGNPFRKQHFNKKYTVEAVNAFLAN